MMWLIGSSFELQIADCRLQIDKKINLQSLPCRQAGKIYNLKYRIAFSLLELLVVVIIIGSLVAFSLPRFRQTFNNLEFDNFCQNLFSQMQYLKERASVEQKIYNLNFDLDNKVIEVKVKDPGSELFLEAKGNLSRKIIIPQNIKIEIDKPSINFYPDNVIEGKGISISDSKNKAEISIRETVGRIELKKE